MTCEAATDNRFPQPLLIVHTYITLNTTDIFIATEKYCVINDVSICLQLQGLISNSFLLYHLEFQITAEFQ